MSTKQKFYLLLTLIILLASSSDAQRRGYRRTPFNVIDGLSVTPKGGFNVFFGDLVDQSRASYSFGVLADREMSRYLSARAQLMGGKMQGEQLSKSLNVPYATFDNFYMEFTVGGSYRPLNHVLGYFKERAVQPYALLQAGLIYYDATEYWGPASFSTVGAQPGEIWRQVTEIAPIVGAGGGFSYWISPNLSANFEFYGTLAFSDRLDAHDVWYDRWPDGNERTTDPYDFYYTLTAGVSYTIQDSPFRNDPRFNRRSYNKTRKFFQPKSRSRSRSARPSSHQRNRFLFF